MHITIVSGPVKRSLQLGPSPSGRSLPNRSAFYLLLLALSLLLASCAVPEKSARWDPVQPAAEAGGEATSPGIARSTEEMSPAMADLIGRADQAIEVQSWPEATAILERALRVNPKQAEAWTRMAIVYLGRNNPEQCIQMAKKSNRHAKTSRALMSYNWLLMSRAYDQLGRGEQAQEALLKSRQLQDGSE